MPESGFARVPLPTWIPGQGRDAVADGISAWLASDAMAALLEAFELPLPPGGALSDRLDRFEAASQRWDYRRGKERHEAVGEEFPPELDATARAATAALGLADCATPPSTWYDHVLVLGGGIRTMLARANLAATLIQSGVTVRTVAGLGSTRPLPDQEKVTQEVGLEPCPTEGDAVDATLRREFGLTGPAERRTEPDWWVRSYLDAKPVVHVLAAPSTRPGLRANTADTYVGWADLLDLEPHGARLLLVTTDLFVPFQHCDAVRLLSLRYDATVNTVGFSTATSPWVKTARTYEVLQEVRAAIDAMRRLYAALSVRGG